MQFARAGKDRHVSRFFCNSQHIRIQRSADNRQPLLHFLGDQANTLNDSRHFGDIHYYGHSRNKSYIRWGFKIRGAHWS